MRIANFTKSSRLGRSSDAAQWTASRRGQAGVSFETRRGKRCRAKSLTKVLGRSVLSLIETPSPGGIPNASSTGAKSEAAAIGLP